MFLWRCGKAALLIVTALVLAAGCTAPETAAPPIPPAPDAAAPEAAAPDTAVAPPAADGQELETSSGRTATIYRDEWGVPHIFAETDADAAYALGYAQAEDRLADIFINIRSAIGSLSEVVGEEAIQRDYLFRLVRNAEMAQKQYSEAPPEVRELGENLVKGIQAYMKQHPEDVPDYAIELESWHPDAVGRCLILQWPIGTIMDDMNNRKEPPAMGSNSWVVSPKRSATGGAILLTDPHLTWEGLQVFYEARVHGDKLHMSGFFILGTPLVGLGHTDHVGWAMTTGGPDTSDAYELTLNPQNPMQYQYDDEWLDAEISQITFPVKGQEAPFSQIAAYTIHGPVVGEPDLENFVAYAGASPYFEDTGLPSQQYKMVTAKNANEFHDALAMNHLFEQNVSFADTEGNIGYVRTGRVPIRPAGFDFSAPVPGNISVARWQGIHPIEDLVGVMNPEQGYMQNCNISPGFMMKDSPMTPDKYKSYIYNVSWDSVNNRGLRARQVLDDDESFTKEEAMALTVDVYDFFALQWQGAIRRAVGPAGPENLADPDLAHAAKLISDWDGEFTKDSSAALLMRFFQANCRGFVSGRSTEIGAQLEKAESAQVLEALAKAAAHVKETYSSLDATWGDAYKVGRGTQYFPCSGADVEYIQTLFNVSYKKLDEEGHFVANQGTMAPQLMFFQEDGIETYSLIPWGQTTDPDSPHFMDQGEKLYSERKFKPSLWNKDDLLKTQVTETVLTIP